MRSVVLAAVILAGCAQPSPEERQRQEAEKAAYMKTPEGQAEAICRFKAEVAMAPRRRGTLMDLALIEEEIRLRKTCQDLHKQTGVMPSY